MSEPKKKPKPGGKHQAPRRLVGLPEEFADALERHAKEKLMTLTEIVRQVLVRYAASEGFWPPPKKGGQ